MAAKFPDFKIKGLTSPPATPFKENGDVNFDLVPAYVQHMQDFGIRNVFVTGTTGEGLQLTLDERKKLGGLWVKEGKGKLDKIIIHIGAGNLRDSQELARDAEEQGADAISCVGTSYYKPETMETYLEYMAAVAGAAPNTPFILYDIDFITGITFDTTEFMMKGKDLIPTLVGVKHTSPNLVSIHNTVLNNPGTQLLLGSDDLYLEGLSIGIELDIVNSYAGNYLNRVREAFKKGDVETARKEQTMGVKVSRIRKKHGLSIPGGTKTVLRTLGLAVGQCRLPLAPVSDEKQKALKQDLEEIGFYEWAQRK